MQDTTQPPGGSPAASLFPPPALRRRDRERSSRAPYDVPAPAPRPRPGASVRVIEAHPFRIGGSRFARVTLAVGALRFRVLASARRVCLPTCGHEEGVDFEDADLAAEVERAARAAAVEAHRRPSGPGRNGGRDE